MAFKVLTLNCNGKRGKLKRKALFSMFKKQKYDIVCLQEVYILEKDYHQWSREWGGLLYYIPGSNHSKGLLCLVKKGLNITDVTQENRGDRILSLYFTYDNKDFQIINIYGPNEEKEKEIFLRTLKNISIPENDNPFCLIVGDFNII